ncbi:VacJ family lipoprotein [Desulfolutivibrio sulfoxidireducens]|uniref:MlaA family lipoprotein n=1 Tax=Desulfolutivibrio sulfoxidireducens TaxID=2773299 RepID=UPI001C40087A|nr:VacJ family lipoprotein [Desulfolutivibrio sulfoxidireducens]
MSHSHDGTTIKRGLLYRLIAVCLIIPTLVLATGCNGVKSQAAKDFAPQSAQPAKASPDQPAAANLDQPAKASPDQPAAANLDQSAGASPDQSVTANLDQSAGASPDQPGQVGSDQAALIQATAEQTGQDEASPFDDDDLYDAPPPPVHDPLQGWNRFWFTFNDYFYMGLRPLAMGYKKAVPEFARTGLKNVYDNFTFPIRFLNALLQLDLTKAAREFGRFMINSTFGVGGLADLAKSDPNLQPGDEDFGQTLGYYGMGEGFYIVWPLLGPSTARDSVGMVGDIAANPLTWVFGLWNVYGEENYWYVSYVVSGGNRFNRLPEYLDNYDAMKKSAIEPYVSMRDFYIQYRQGRIEQ